MNKLFRNICFLIDIAFPPIDIIYSYIYVLYFIRGNLNIKCSCIAGFDYLGVWYDKKHQITVFVNPTHRFVHVCYYWHIIVLPVQN